METLLQYLASINIPHGFVVYKEFGICTLDSGSCENAKYYVFEFVVENCPDLLFEYTLNDPYGASITK